jgi:hypothetical protein
VKESMKKLISEKQWDNSFYLCWSEVQQIEKSPLQNQIKILRSRYQMTDPYRSFKDPIYNEKGPKR